MKPSKRALAAVVVAALALLAALRQPAPRQSELKEVVTHKICYTDVDGYRHCE